MLLGNTAINLKTIRGLCIICICMKQVHSFSSSTCIWCMTENTRGCHDVISQRVHDITCCRGVSWWVNIYNDAYNRIVTTSSEPAVEQIKDSDGFKSNVLQKWEQKTSVSGSDRPGPMMQTRRQTKSSRMFNTILVRYTGSQSKYRQKFPNHQAQKTVNETGNCEQNSQRTLGNCSSAHTGVKMIWPHEGWKAGV